HAAIATECKVVEDLAKQGLTKEIVGRDAFVKNGWEWYDKFGGRICNQLKHLGISCDWDRLSFTMDENLNRAVRHVFVSYYNKGYIYKGKRIVNWCPHCKSAISDAENEYVDQSTNIWHIRYPFADGSGEIVVATTRPETMFGDTAVAVNPKDKRYANIIGKNLILPLTKRQIPVVADEYCEMDFGTGAVKITPAHDPNDYELGLRHKLEIISCIDDSGVLTDVAGEFCGQDRFVARKNIIKKLEEDGYLVKTEKYKNKVGTCQRCHTITEPKISLQWFVKMEELAKPAIDVCKTGELKFFPKRFEKQYINWLAGIKDWCISRQIWLGHRIPAYTCNDCRRLVVSEDAPSVCPDCGGTHFTQESDVLDTWFSSALWPFSTLGFPDKSEDLNFYYPTSTLVTGYDIISFWVSKMVFSGIEFMGKCPFEHVVINGLVRDSIGRKMSKSLNNGIDPLELISKYGADSLRMSLISGMSMGADVKYSEDRAVQSKIFINKLWNASKFVISNCDNFEFVAFEKLQLSYSDKWILKEFNTLTKDVNKLMDKYDQGIVIGKIVDFVWGKYCDWYIELAKTNVYSESANTKNNAMNILVFILDGILKLIHPFIPFVTEEIYQNLPIHEKTIMLCQFPEFDEKLNFKEAAGFEKIITLIKAIRNNRAEMNVPDNKRTAIYIKILNNKEMIILNLKQIEKLAFGSDVIEINDSSEICDKTVNITTEIADVFLPMSELVDSSKEIERLKKELFTIESEIERSKKMLANAGFVLKAPKSLIENETLKLEKNEQLKIQLKDKLDKMQ
ncbi:MAG: valine--tRNA ligase, partial [Clostridia bacterium]